MDETTIFDRFVVLTKRELHADDVRILTSGEAPPDAPNVLTTRLPDGRHVVVSFENAPADREAIERRLAILVTTFAESLTGSGKSRARPPVATSLHEELKALASRARAIDAVVIDVDSPVVWGTARSPIRARPRSDLILREVTAEDLPGEEEDAAVSEVAPHAEESGFFGDGREPEAESEAQEATRAAIGALREQGPLDQLHRGRHFRHVERDKAYSLALSFSGIYILLLVFDGPFDELRAERAAQDALPRVERLVEALPPLDPTPQPMGGVVSLRRRRK